MSAAFGIDKTDGLNDRNVILVDDVMTTGTTASEVSRLLRRESGVARIMVLPVARVPRMLNRSRDEK